MEIITAKDLIKDYNGFRAVDGVSFSIVKGECFGFLGPNGAGKTTIMRIIHCFLPPTGGEVRVLGYDVTKEPSLIKARMGVMPQDDSLDPDLSVIQNLVVYGRYFDMPKKKTVPLARELLASVGLTDKMKANIRELSGGMKRSLLLARSIVNDPDVIILDEPTTGLDPHSRQMVWKRLEDLKRQGKTLLLTTHYMEEAERLCDRVAIMDRGKIIVIASPRDLMDEHGGNLEAVYLTLTGRKLED
ncbi:MAG: ABC transporter ATP-binding protein [Syntrophorhabdus sp.]|jgi:lipooligosaccharide transport system ATP-binding protein|nr:ABC transporter ATP-binding protein [Syntrophorhabdus sp.]